MFNLTLKNHNKLIVDKANTKSSFHTSQSLNRYGRQNKSRPKKNFFRPNWRYILNLQNLLYHGLDGGNQFNKILPFINLPNYPIGDSNIKRRKELVAPFDEVKDRYFKLFPDDRTTYLYDTRAEGKEWYQPPVDRFIGHIAHHLVHDEKELTIMEAFDLALKDKKYEEEARRIEFEVQKQQAEILFGYEEKDWLKEQNRGDKFEEEFDNDPREEEKADNIKEQKLLTLVNQRMINPKRQKIRLADTQMTFFEVAKWLTLNPEYKQFFHESIYWGDVPYHELFLEDQDQVEAEPGEPEPGIIDPEEEYDYDDDEDGQLVGDGGENTETTSENNSKKLRQAKKALENDTLLEDLNLSMSGWAKDLLAYFSDATNTMVSPNHEKEACAAVMARDELVKEMGVWVENALDRKFVEDSDIIPTPNRLFKNGADEAIQDSLKKKPYVSTTLEDELTNLFRNVPGQDEK